MGTKLTYKDEHGNLMYGFSLISLEQNTQAIRNQTRVIFLVAAVLMGALMFAIWLVWYVDRHNILSNIVKYCV